MWRCGLVAIAACGFQPGAGPNDSSFTVDAPPMFDDAGHEIVPWVMDTVTDFSHAGTGWDPGDMAIEEPGLLTPGGFFYGSLMITGEPTDLWANVADDKLDWTPVATATPTGSGLWNGESLTSTADLASIGVTNDSNFSAWFEGEVFLQAGTETFQLDTDKHAFLMIAPPGTSAFTEVVYATNGPTSGPFTATTAGWYPIRIGWGEGNGQQVHLAVAQKTAGSFAPLTRPMLRARGDRVVGAMQLVYGRQMFGSFNGLEPITAAYTTTLINTDFGTPPHGTYGTNDWSARYAGQLYSPVGGAYTFKATSSDGNQLAIAGVQMSSHWTHGDNTSNATTTLPIKLAIGWNDLALDYNQVSGSRSLQLAATAVPSGDTLVANQPIPATRFRAVEPPGDRLAFGSDPTHYTIKDNQPASNNAQASFTVPALSTETATSIDVSIDYFTPKADDLVFTLQNPSGGVLTLCDRTHCGTGPQGQNNGQGAANLAFHVTDATTLANAFGAGSWKLTGTDAGANGGDSAMFGVSITIHTSGGPDKLAKVATWTSEVVDNGGATGAGRLFSVDNVTWIEHATTHGADVVLRSCDMADCSDGAWTTPIAQSSAPPLPPKRYLQAQITLYSDGAADSELDRIDITYRKTTM